jgi:hypothetical protein
MRIPVTDRRLERFDAYLSRRPVGFIGFVLIVFGILTAVSPQHQYVVSTVFLSAGGAIEVTVISAELLLSSRRKRRERENETEAIGV